MHNDSPYIHIGTLLHTRGVHGQLVAPLELSIESLEPITFIFLQVLGDTHVPYQLVEKRLIEPDKAWLKLRNITSKEAAHSLLGKNIWLLRETLQQLTITSSCPQELIDYEVQDVHLGSLGTVMDIAQFPQQQCLDVTYNHQSLLIPYIPAFIQNVDPQHRSITVCLPEGFLEAMEIKT